MKVCLGVIVGNRGFFPGYLAEEGRKEILGVLKKQGIDAVIIPENQAKYGAIENLKEAKRCAELFRKNISRIDGILVTLPNFGDERAIAEAIRLSELDVPVLVHAYPDELKKMDVKHRRDSLCGKFSVCNNLKQYRIPFSLTRLHTVSPSSKDFMQDLEWFAGVCRVVKGVRHARIGAIGARTTPFKTVRFNEKLLEENGISVETVDLLEIIVRMEKLKDSEKNVQSELASIRRYCPCSEIPEDAMLKIAKLSVSIKKWVEENELNACAIRCWTELQDYLGVFPCVVMSMLSNSLIPTACEVDVLGALAMYTLQLASGNPSGLFDWNNNYGLDPDRVVLFHCSNAPGSMLKDARMSYNAIHANVRGTPECSYGTCVGRIKPGPMTFLRISDTPGSLSACMGEGEFTDDPVETFGGVGVAKIENLQRLFQVLCKNGFEHHVAVNQAKVADIIFEAASNYLAWDVYYHNQK